MGLIIHFITHEFERKIVTIRCVPYNSSHTGESIHGRFTFILEFWELPRESILLIISDTAKNMVKAFVDENCSSCFEHVLALVIKKSIFTQSGIKSILKKVKFLVKKLRTSKGKRILKADHSLKLPVKTRWNSNYIMLESLNKCKEQVMISQVNPTLEIPVRAQLSPNNWEVV